MTPEQEPIRENEPTIEWLAEVLKDDLTKEQLADMAEMTDLQEALGVVISYLLENDIKDPEGYLMEKGILEG